MGFRTRVQTVLQVLRSKSNGTRVLSFSCAIPQNYYIVHNARRHRFELGGSVIG